MWNAQTSTAKGGRPSLTVLQPSVVQSVVAFKEELYDFIACKFAEGSWSAIDAATLGWHLSGLGLSKFEVGRANKLSA